MRLVLHATVVVLLTLITLLGGIAWLLAMRARRRVATFFAAFVALWGLATVAAPLAGRVALPCRGEGPLIMASPLYCALDRHYVLPEMGSVLEDLAAAMPARAPGTPTLALDANFPFLDGFPLLPHLSPTTTATRRISPPGTTAPHPRRSAIPPSTRGRPTARSGV